MSHDRNQSILYKVTSPQMLADRLLISREELDALLADADPYKRWIDKKSGRAIQEPRPRLAKVHRRIAMLLARIDTPPYLHSAKKGRSYISNAAAHSVEDGCVKIDVRRFYPSARAQAVYHFFRDRMACEGDVAGMLAKLLTVDGHLPTGSSASPIVSYFAYEDLFHELSVLAEACGCKMTVYVDDIVFTGAGATRRLLFEARKAIGKRHLHGHKTKLFRPVSRGSSPELLSPTTAFGCRTGAKSALPRTRSCSMTCHLAARSSSSHGGSLDAYLKPAKSMQGGECALRPWLPCAMIFKERSVARPA